MKIEVWMEDKKTGIQCGLNRYGKLFLGNSESGYNLPDTPENRERVIHDFCRYTGRQRPVIMANGKPYKGKETMIDFSRQQTESYISVDNELTLQAVFEIFKERAKDTFNFID